MYNTTRIIIISIIKKFDYVMYIIICSYIYTYKRMSYIPYVVIHDAILRYYTRC